MSVDVAGEEGRGLARSEDGSCAESAGARILSLDSGEPAQLLEALSRQLEGVWSELSASEAERDADSAAAATAACQALRLRLDIWAARRQELEDTCRSLAVQCLAAAAPLSGSEAAEVAAVGALRLPERRSALHLLLAQFIVRLRERRGELLHTLGRDATEGDGSAGADAATLAAEVVRLQEDIHERCASVAQATRQLHGLWDELRVPAHEVADEALGAVLQAGCHGFAVTDVQHAMLLGCLERWRAERERLQAELMAVHGRLLALAQVCVSPAEQADLERFLGAHGHCWDLPACCERERELRILAQGLRHRLLRRRREALAFLGRAEPLNELGDADSLVDEGIDPQGLLALSREVEDAEHEVNVLRGRQALEAARLARALWEELGEAPDADGRDAAAAGLLDDEAAAEPIASAQEAAAAAASLAAWQARHRDVTVMVARLHAELVGFGEAGKAAVRQHGTLHCKDRSACKARLRELREEEKRADAERSAQERMRRHCKKGLDEPQAYHTSMCELREYQRATFGVRG